MNDSMRFADMNPKNMKNPKTTWRFIKSKYDTDEIEKHLIYAFLTHHRLNYAASRLLSGYLADLSIDISLLEQIRNVCCNTVDELAADMEFLIPENDKRVKGVFFTPSYIVDYIIHTISPAASDKVIDISCGSGAFLLGIIKYYRQKYNKSIREIVADNLYGADILAYNVRRSKLFIALLGLEEGEIIEESHFHIKHTDSLRETWEMKFDVVVGNPPYVKFQDLEEDVREYLIEHFTTTQNGTFNLYFAFYELGLTLLKPNGKLGYITPNNYFTSLAGKSLRTYFHRNCSIYQIMDFNCTKVFSVQTYTAITFLNTRQNKKIEYGRIDRETPSDFLKKNQTTGNLYSMLHPKKWRLLCYDERENIDKIENIGHKIGDLFNICVGIATLKDEVYSICPTDEDDTYFYIERNQIHYKIEKGMTRSLVKISDMKSQQDLENNRRRIIFPYRTTDGKTSVIPEDEMKTKYPECYHYLLSVKAILLQRGKGKQAFSPFYSYGRTQGLNRKGIKLLTPTFSQYPRFLIDSNEESLFTNGYGIYIHTESSGLFPDSWRMAAPQKINTLQKILNSGVMHYYIVKTSVSIEGGYPCYQKNFIERFTIPPFDEQEIRAFEALTNPAEIDQFLINKYQLNLDAPNRPS